MMHLMASPSYIYFRGYRLSSHPTHAFDGIHLSYPILYSVDVEKNLNSVEILAPWIIDGSGAAIQRCSQRGIRIRQQ